jgi:hypothetical protein
MTGGKRGAHVKAALQFTVAAQLHEHNLVQGQTDKVEGLRYGGTNIFGVSHFVSGGQ